MELLFGFVALQPTGLPTPTYHFKVKIDFVFVFVFVFLIFFPNCWCFSQFRSPPRNTSVKMRYFIDGFKLANLDRINENKSRPNWPLFENKPRPEFTDCNYSVGSDIKECVDFTA